MNEDLHVIRVLLEDYDTLPYSGCRAFLHSFEKTIDGKPFGMIDGSETRMAGAEVFVHFQEDFVDFVKDWEQKQKEREVLLIRLSTSMEWSFSSFLMFSKGVASANFTNSRSGSSSVSSVLMIFCL